MKMKVNSYSIQCDQYILKNVATALVDLPQISIPRPHHQQQITCKTYAENVQYVCTHVCTYVHTLSHFLIEHKNTVHTYVCEYIETEYSEYKVLEILFYTYTTYTKLSER